MSWPEPLDGSTLALEPRANFGAPSPPHYEENCADRSPVDLDSPDETPGRRPTCFSTVPWTRASTPF